MLSQSPAGEKHQRFLLFGPVCGLFPVLYRQSTQNNLVQLPDFLTEVECWSAKSRLGSTAFFVREFQIHATNREICKSPKKFLVASQIAKFFIDNGAHLFEPLPQFNLLEKVIRAFAKDADSNLILFKFYFEFSRKEGLPVRESWLPRLSLNDRAFAEDLLAGPVNRPINYPSRLDDLLVSIQDWMKAETEIIT